MIQRGHDSFVPDRQADVGSESVQGRPARAQTGQRERREDETAARPAAAGCTPTHFWAPRLVPSICMEVARGGVGLARLGRRPFAMHNCSIVADRCGAPSAGEPLSNPRANGTGKEAARAGS
ncbi:hypothetical protein VFPFJ_08602 [Purpureocillium lilacinum]|uniref:Uncharacterized protein n=1 Tax=Purpureocillium lilacinum TaxID=33203 RepID=A0A179H0A4_PURLI|nr:hypothetical protein VFPFJ_08602 [Purpureocillium lilacinum]OAQ82799.1 hypothetical protein VFPFJ_08602 [Purpureocillium lilacinum]